MINNTWGLLTLHKVSYQNCITGDIDFFDANNSLLHSYRMSTKYIIYLLGKKIDFEEFTTSLNEKLQDDHRMDEID